MPLSQRARQALEEAFPPGAYVVYLNRLFEVEEWSPQGLLTMSDCCTGQHRHLRDEHVGPAVELVRAPAVPDTIEFDEVADEPAA